MTIKHNVSAGLTSFITATNTHERAILIGGLAIRDWHAAQTHALTGTTVTLPINPLFPALRSGQRLFQGPPVKSRFLAILFADESEQVPPKRFLIVLLPTDFGQKI